MAEFVERRCEDMIPVLEQMEKLKLFTQEEVKNIAKKHKELEYKIQRHTKSKEDYLKYIHYEMNLMKLVKQRRVKHRITQKKYDIDFTIANKIKWLYTETIFRFQDDVRFWIAYIKFCKNVKFLTNVSRMIARMLQVHQDKPKCWHIAAKWELEESKNIDNARQYLLRGLHFHPESELLVTDLFKLELDETYKKKEIVKGKEEKISDPTEFPEELKRVIVIYDQAVKKVKDVNFLIELLNIVQAYDGSEKLQIKIVTDIVKEYPNDPITWDTMARRELQGLVMPSLGDDSSAMEIDNPESSSVRDRISCCYEVYQAAVKRIKTEEMWSLFIDCMLEINQNTDSLPNYKRKLLKSALLLAHQAKKLKEKYYLYWIDMLSFDQIDDKIKSKLYEVLCWATEAHPKSENLWLAKLNFLYSTDQENLATEAFSESLNLLEDNCIELWKAKLIYLQSKSPEKLGEFYDDALKSKPCVRNFVKPLYIEWIVLTKDIFVARKTYEDLCTVPPLSLEVHKKMATLELLQPEISLKHARRPHEMATLQFGKLNTDVWMEYIRFETKHGEPTKVAQIYDRAVKTLRKNIVDNFITEFSLIKANDSLSEI